MLVELLNELLNEASPFYFYVSWLVTIFCLYNFVYMGLDGNKASSELRLRNYHGNQYRLLSVSVQNGADREILNWITTKTKRKDGPEDDDENSSFSLQSNILKNEEDNYGQVFCIHSFKNASVYFNYYCFTAFKRMSGSIHSN